MMRQVPILLFWFAVLFALVMASLTLPLSLPADPGDKQQHVMAFVMLSILAAWAYPRLPLPAIFLGLAAFGGMIEIIQLIPQLGRRAELADWAVDCAASAITLLVVAALRFLLRRVFHAAGEGKEPHETSAARQYHHPQGPRDGQPRAAAQPVARHDA